MNEQRIAKMVVLLRLKAKQVSFSKPLSETIERMQGWAKDGPAW